MSLVPKPVVSIIVTARNDDHGADFIRRMQAFYNGLLHICDAHEFQAELIVVEWNPMAGRPPLKEALRTPKTDGYCAVRFIEVPAQIHNRFKFAKGLGLFQMIAKNVGIRRASADFVLCTNIDILLSHELIEYMKSGNLKKGIVYRVDRYDVPEDVPIDGTIDEQLAYCENNLLRVNAREGTTNFTTNAYFCTYININTDSTHLHFNACGDFTLLHIDDWMNLRGYAEFDMYSAHIDSVFLMTAYYSGIRQVILKDPMRTYHIEHGHSMIAEKASKLSRDLKSAGVTELIVPQLEAWAEEMNRTGRPILFNDRNWGLVDEALKDETFVLGIWDREGDRPSQSPLHKDPISDNIATDKLTVIVPISSKSDDVAPLLRALVRQTLSTSEFEVLIACARDTFAQRSIQSFSEQLNIRVVEIDGTGQGALMAEAVEKAASGVLLFLPPDMLPKEDTLKRHLEFHRNNSPCPEGILSALSMKEQVLLGSVDPSSQDAGTTASHAFRARFHWTSDNVDTPELKHFCCENLSIRKDAILRYGNFDPTFAALADVELGFRLFSHPFTITRDANAAVTLTGGYSKSYFEDLAELEGQFACVASWKHGISELERSVFFRNVDARSMHTAQMCVDNASFINLVEIDREKRKQGARRCEKDRLTFFRRIHENKQPRAGEHVPKRVLFVSKHPPLLDGSENDLRFLKTLENLSKHFLVTVLCTESLSRGRSVEHIRKMGVVVFYDTFGILEQSEREPVKPVFASSIDPALLVNTVLFDVAIVDESAADRYFPTLLHHSPLTLLIVDASNSPVAQKNSFVETSHLRRASRILIREGADTRRYPNTVPIEAMSATDVEGIPVRVIQEIIDAQTGYKLTKTQALFFQVDPAALPERFVRTTAAVTVIHILNDGFDSCALSRRSVHSTLKDSAAEVLHAIPASDIRLRNEFEDTLRYYFTYTDEQSLFSALSAVAAGCNSPNTAILDCTIVTPPMWLARLMTHLDKDSECQAIFPTTSDTVYQYLSDLNNDAWDCFDKTRGCRRPASHISVPCAIFRSEFLKTRSPKKLSELFHGQQTERSGIFRAEDVLIWHIKPNLKTSRPTVFNNEFDRKLSIIVGVETDFPLRSDLLERLISQTVPFHSQGGAEIVFADATKNFESKTRFAGPASVSPIPITFLHDKNGYISTALNAGIRASKGAYLLFLSADVLPGETWVSSHLATHEKNQHRNIAVLGKTTYAPAKVESPLSAFLKSNADAQKACEYIFDNNLTGYAELTGLPFLYTVNLSVPRTLIADTGLFRPQLRHGFHNTEYSVRFLLRGHRILYDEKAEVRYCREVDLDTYLARQREAGRQAVLLAAAQPHVMSLEWARGECANGFFQKEHTAEKIRAIAHTLEAMSDELRRHYRFSDLPLDYLCYAFLSRFHFAQGVNDALTDMEGSAWTNDFMRRRDIEPRRLKEDAEIVDLIFETAFAVCDQTEEAFLRAVSPEWKSVHPFFDYAEGMHFLMRKKNPEEAVRAFKNGLEKLKRGNYSKMIPMVEEVFFHLRLATALINQRNFIEAKGVLENFIQGRTSVFLLHGVVVYQMLSFCYRALRQEKRAAYCTAEAERLKGEYALTKGQ